jgi:hypothetical protein
MDEALLEVRQEVLDRAGQYLGEWNIPNLSTPVTAIAITPDPDSGDTYPPPGTDLISGVECVVRTVDISAPWLDETFYKAIIEVVLAAPNNLGGVIDSVIAILKKDNYYYLHSNTLSTNDGNSQKIVKLRTHRRIKANG